MTGHEVSEAEIRRVLREIADAQYEEVHASDGRPHPARPVQRVASA